MSRWFPEPVVLRVGDAQAAVPAASATLPLSIDDASAAPTGQTRVDATLSAFERDLDQRALKYGTRVTFVVAGEGVRYLIVPWNDELASPAQRQVLAEHCFKEAYGEAVRNWVVCQHAPRYGAATLACALDAALLERLNAIAQVRRIKLVSVQPSLMQAYNRSPHRPAPGPFWFVSIEALRTTVLLMSPSEPLQVKQLPSAGLDLALSLDREWFALGLEGPRCPVHFTRSQVA